MDTNVVTQGYRTSLRSGYMWQITEWLSQLGHRPYVSVLYVGLPADISVTLTS